MRNGRLVFALGIGILVALGALSATQADDWLLESVRLKVVSDTNLALATAPAVVLAAPVDAADSTAISATPVRPKSTRNCPRVVVSPTLSANGATVCLAVIAYHKTGSTYAFASVAAVQTFSGSVVPTTDSGRFTTTDGFMTAPTLGCQIYDVRVLAISTGNVTWRSWPLGADSAPSTTTDE